jgi:hypothetical protein
VAAGEQGAWLAGAGSVSGALLLMQSPGKRPTQARASTVLLCLGQAHAKKIFLAQKKLAFCRRVCYTTDNGISLF